MLLKTQGRIPGRLIAGQRHSCRTVMPSVVRITAQDANNRAEFSHHPRNGSRRHTELCRISFESGDIYSSRRTTAYSDGGHSSNGMRQRVRAERARANDLKAEQLTVRLIFR